MIWYLTWVSIGLLSMSINGILMGDCCAFIIISKFIFWWVRKNCFAIKSINAAAIKWKRESNSAAPSLVLAAYTSWVSHSRMMRPLYALAVKRTSEFFLKILDCRRTRASKKPKKTFAFFWCHLPMALLKTKHALFMQKQLAEQEPKTIVQASIFSEKGGWEHSILCSAVHSLNRL